MHKVKHVTYTYFPG